MTNTKNEDKGFSTREDKIIRSTLILCEDNNKQLILIDNLKSCLAKKERLECDSEIKLDLIKSLNNISSSMKDSHELSKFHLKKVNHNTSQIEEAYERIKDKEDSY